jgi:uncharacterized membrane protein YjjP (DUF1212 family)
MPESEITEEFQSRRLFTERLYKELQTVEEFRFKFSTMKITFVIGLLGIGAVKLKVGHNIDLSPALLLAPLVAVLFDILSMAATVNIYRIDAFLRIKGESDEKEWQYFLKKHSSSFYLWAATGFTVTTLVASLFLTALRPLPYDISVCWLMVWLIFIIILLVFFRCWEHKVKKRLLNSEAGSKE